ncbi:MAG: chitobiase/beta-hexosaminidase C-terminal domain-containing protein [Treponema sp.]|nr:chitobiase/beta-hexosaminidase C-terminal domain-containing protein [Treponema sp.]
MRRFYLFLTVVLFLFFSCANNIADNKNDLAAMLILQNLQKKETSNTTVKYGSITINTGNSESRATDVASISRATVTVYWGNKAEEKKDALVDFSGNGTGSVTINEIPVGKNRVIVVEAAENINNIINKMAGIEISAVTDIKAGNNNVTVNWKSTAEGNVYRKLLSSSEVNFENISRDDVQALINENVHSSLIDSDSIAEDIINNSKKSADSYVKTAGSVKFTSGSSENNVIFQVCDPASAKLNSISSGVNKISGVTPGTWKVFGVLNNSVIFSKSVDVASGAEVDLGTIQFKTPVPRLEDSTGKQISEFISGSTKVYLNARTYDDETPLSDVVIYYTTDGTEPDASSTKYTSAGISVDVGTTLKAVAISSLLGNSNVSSWTFEKPSIGMQHPKTGNYSVASTDTTAVLGANVKGDKTSFVLYSANATKVLLEIYSKPFGDAVPLYDYWMEKDSNNYWRITLNGNLKNAIYAFRCWGPNWTYSDSWTRGGSAAGFVADYDSKGNRFNPNKVVFDPYAKEITHDPSNKDALLHSPSTEKPYNALSTGADFRNYDTGKIAPKGYIISDSTSYGTKPGIPQKDAIIYEAHVRGITKHSSTANLSSLLSGYSQFASVQDIPSEYRGTYKGASYLVPYLKALGINTIELLPVHETDNDANPDDGPGGNFWGYMTFDYFAPDRRYSYDKTPGGPTKEFKEMVKAFHDAGMEVYLDVVYNHSGEGGPWNGSKDNNAQVTVVSMRGIDNSTYYSLVPSDKSAYWETTGCGNNLQCDNPYVRGFILDSLEYWIDEMGVDGFRFDLATVLGREYSSSSSGWDYNLNAETTVKIAELGKAKNVEMIAESWDCGNNSYQVGNFPDGWAGWNGYYRDSIRAFVGNGAERAAISYTDGIYGSLNHFGAAEPSVNFVVAHDGFTLADLCSYSGAGNALNGTLTWPFGPSDGGNGDNNSLRTGTEDASNRQRARNYFAMQMFSAGIPMIVYGDEFGRTQNGNNNPYNIDSVATWNNYLMVATDSPHTVSTGSDGKAECGTYTDKFGKFANTEGKNGNFDFARFVMNERLNNESLRQITGVDAPIEWYSTAGVKGWEDSGCKKAVMINGSGAKNGGTYYMMINMTGSDASFTIPAPSSGNEWTRIVDTGNWAETNCNYWEETDTSYRRDSSSTYSVGPYTVTILKQVADSPVCATPVISGTSPFDTSTQITIECSTEGAKIYYTLNGNTPSEKNGTLYTGAFTVTEITSVKAIAVLDGYKTSSVASKTFYVKGQVSESSKTAVMLQGFTWNSAPRGTGWNKENPSPYWGKWYDIMKKNASSIKDTFEYVWFNPPSICDSSSSEGYAPTELNNLNSYYGTATELKEVIQAIQPAKAIADIVVNHRAGSTCWGDFTNPDWGVVKGVKYPAICSDDEAFNASSGDKDHMVGKPSGAADTGASYGAYRDLDHTNTVVQQGIIDWMNNVLKPAGFVGWRYDYVKGFGARYVGQYNAGSSAEFSVGEYWPTAGYSIDNPSSWGNEIKNWISGTESGGQRSRAFDFALKGAMNGVFNEGKSYAKLADDSNLYISQPTDAVTFVDNHDTGSNQNHWPVTPEKVGLAYALILTHPGVPCVAWSHYFTFAEGGNGDTTYPYSSISAAGTYVGGSNVAGTSNTLRQHIDYLIGLRKELGIEYDSERETKKADSSGYAAEITGTNGSLIVLIGSGYTPSDSEYEEVYSGTSFKIWKKDGSGVQKCRTPVITISGGNATITCGTDGATIMYGFSSTAMNSTYSAPVTMTDGQTIYAYATKDGLEDSGVASKTYTSLTTFKATSSATWITDDGCVVFAWCWGGGAGEGAWYAGTSDSSGGFTWEAPGDITNFLLARCINGTTEPDWDNKSDTPGRVYNQTDDCAVTSGTTQYTVQWK